MPKQLHGVVIRIGVVPLALSGTTAAEPNMLKARPHRLDESVGIEAHHLTDVIVGRSWG